MTYDPVAEVRVCRAMLCSLQIIPGLIPPIQIATNGRENTFSVYRSPYYKHHLRE